MGEDKYGGEGMKIIYLHSIGTRDITKGGKHLSKPREEGEEIYKNFANYKSILEAPLIKPSIELVLEKEKPLKREDFVVFLFATDQPEAVPPELRSLDTIFLGQVAIKLLQPIYKGEWNCKVIKNINPALYDETYKWFSRELKRIAENEKPDKVYVNPTAGTPAITIGLLLQSLLNFGQKVQVIYNIPLSGPIQVDFPRAFLNTLISERVKQSLKTYNYTIAANLLDEMGAEFAKDLALYVHHRLSFNFKEADILLRGTFAKAPPQQRIELNKVIDALNPLLKEPEGNGVLPFLTELYYNAQITWKIGRYADFLSRFFRFQEAVLRYLVEKYLQLPTEKEKEEEFRNGIKQNTALKDFLKEQTVEGTPLDYTKMSIPTFLACLKFLKEKGIKPDGSLLPEAERTTLEGIYNLLNKMETLNKWRHKSITGHGFKGVSEEEILQEYGNSPLEDMAEVLRLLGQDISLNPFDKANELIERSL